MWAVNVEAMGTLTRLTLAVHPSLPKQCTQKYVKDYAQFYYVGEVNGKLACVTKCTLWVK